MKEAVDGIRSWLITTMAPPIPHSAGPPLLFFRIPNPCGGDSTLCGRQHLCHRSWSCTSILHPILHRSHGLFEWTIPRENCVIDLVLGIRW